jgi:hypothetical protein
MDQSESTKVESIDDALNEWTKAMTNPDNVIISDSLSDRLAPEDLKPEIVNTPSTSISCSFMFEDYTIGGTLISCSDAEGIRTYSLLAPVAQVLASLKRSNLLSAVVMQSGVEDPVIVEVDPRAEVGVSSHIQDGSTAMITISFSDSVT